jgi:hypothetical protein
MLSANEGEYTLNTNKLLLMWFPFVGTEGKAGDFMPAKHKLHLN